MGKDFPYNHILKYMKLQQLNRTDWQIIETRIDNSKTDPSMLKKIAYSMVKEASQINEK